MFGQVRNFIDAAVEKAGGVAKVTVAAATGVATVVVAGSIKQAYGENPVSRKMWEIQDKVSGRLCGIIDDSLPVAKAIAKVPVRKAERIVELGAGVGQVLFTENKKEGYQKIEESLTEMAAMLITGGIAGAAVELCADAADIADETASIPGPALAVPSTSPKS